jgi:hypothetical protein
VLALYWFGSAYGVGIDRMKVFLLHLGGTANNQVKPAQ